MTEFDPCHTTTVLAFSTDALIASDHLTFVHQSTLHLMKLVPCYLVIGRTYGAGAPLDRRPTLAGEKQFDS